MIAKLAHLILSAVLGLVSFGPAQPTIDSVQALQSKGQTFCTAFSVNEADGEWATAAHCAAYALDHQMDVTIEGQPAYVVFVGFPAADVAVFQSAAHAPAFHIAKHGLAIGDAVSIIGYPYGIARVETWGRVGAKDVPIEHPSTHYYMASDILDLTSAGGNSGSPVLNEKGELVGVLWGGFTDSPHSLAIPYESVRRVLAAFSAE